MSVHSFATCEGRFFIRQSRWVKSGVSFPKFRHGVWWFLHNVVAHPMLAYPTKTAIWFHDWTSLHLNQRKKLLPSPWPYVSDWGSWIKHNVVAHVAIGIAPCAVTFLWHDATADQMNVEDWV